MKEKESDRDLPQLASEINVDTTVKFDVTKEDIARIAVAETEEKAKAFITSQKEARGEIEKRLSNLVQTEIKESNALLQTIRNSTSVLDKAETLEGLVGGQVEKTIEVTLMPKWSGLSSARITENLENENACKAFANVKLHVQTSSRRKNKDEDDIGSTAGHAELKRVIALELIPKAKETLLEMVGTYKQIESAREDIARCNLKISEGKSILEDMESIERQAMAAVSRAALRKSEDGKAMIGLLEAMPVHKRMAKLLGEPSK
jgi:hypothetical protein